MHEENVLGFSGRKKSDFTASEDGTAGRGTPRGPATSRGSTVCVSIRSTHKQLVRLRFQVNLSVSAGLGRAEKKSVFYQDPLILLTLPKGRLGNCSCVPGEGTRCRLQKASVQNPAGSQLSGPAFKFSEKHWGLALGKTSCKHGQSRK